MHSLLKSKEVPINLLLLAIYHLQLYFLKEIKRGKAGISGKALVFKQNISLHPSRIIARPSRISRKTLVFKDHVTKLLVFEI